MKVNEMYPSRWLKAENVTEPVLATIRSCEMVTFTSEEGDQEKPAVYFEGSEAGLILNKTNANMIAAILKEDDTDQWIGKQIGLRSEMVPFKGKPVPSIRVFDPTPPKTGGFGKKAPTGDDVPTSWPSDGMPAAEVTLEAGGAALFEGDIPDPGAPMTSKQKQRRA